MNFLPADIYISNPAVKFGNQENTNSFYGTSLAEFFIAVSL